MAKGKPKNFNQLRDVAEQAAQEGKAKLIQHDAESFTVSNQKGTIYVSTKGHKSLDNVFVKRVIAKMTRMGILLLLIAAIAAIIYYHPFV